MSSEEVSTSIAPDGFEVYRTEALIANLHVPEVYPKIVSRDVGFAIGVYRNGVYVVGVSISIDLSRNCSHDLILRVHSW